MSRMGSPINLPGTYADCAGATKVPITFFNLMARALDGILVSSFNREMPDFNKSFVVFFLANQDYHGLFL